MKHCHVPQDRKSAKVRPRHLQKITPSRTNIPVFRSRDLDPVTVAGDSDGQERLLHFQSLREKICAVFWPIKGHLSINTFWGVKSQHFANKLL